MLVMELVDGETLAGRIALASTGSSARMRETLAIAEQIAAALEASARAGDHSPRSEAGNILLRPDGTVKVLDFGLAKALASRDDSAAADVTVTVTDDAPRSIGPGTPAYMSPEQARGLAVDKRTDVWSFGCVLYELLTGLRAFGGDARSLKGAIRTGVRMAVRSTTGVEIVMVIRIDTAAGVRAASEPRVVLDPFLPPYYDDYDIHPDGRTLMFVRPSAATQPLEVTVVANWLPELSRLVGAGAAVRPQ
jgi:serine/threonine protein kinase